MTRRICFSLMDRLPTGMVTSMGKPPFAMISAAFLLSSFQGTVGLPFWYSGIKRFSVTVQSLTTCGSCVMMEMNSSLATLGDMALYTCPFTRISPRVGGMMPDMMSTSVDLPAPFFPMIPCSSPFFTLKLTFSSATVPA